MNSKQITYDNDKTEDDGSSKQITYDAEYIVGGNKDKQIRRGD